MNNFTTRTLRRRTDPPPIFSIGRALDPKPPRCARVILIGDTYGSRTVLPAGDILIHVGNFTEYGTGVAAFTDYLARLHYDHVVVIAGYHETPSARHIMDGSDACTYLAGGASTSAKGLRIQCVSDFDTRGEIVIKPLNCTNDIVISHVPPTGVLDENEYGEHVGNIELAQQLIAHPPRVCVFSGAAGHGAMIWHDILCINAGIYGIDGVEYGVPLCVDIAPRQ
jgi:hypothetical protein